MWSYQMTHLKPGPGERVITLGEDFELIVDEVSVKAIEHYKAFIGKAPDEPLCEIEHAEFVEAMQQPLGEPALQEFKRLAALPLDEYLTARGLDVVRKHPILPKLFDLLRKQL